VKILPNSKAFNIPGIMLLKGWSMWGCMFSMPSLSWDRQGLSFFAWKGVTMQETVVVLHFTTKFVHVGLVIVSFGMSTTYNSSSLCNSNLPMMFFLKPTCCCFKKHLQQSVVRDCNWTDCAVRHKSPLCTWTLRECQREQIHLCLPNGLGQEQSSAVQLYIRN
jgi:hypothetical protein